MHHIGARKPRHAACNTHGSVRQRGVAEPIVRMFLAIFVHIEAGAVIERIVFQQQEGQLGRGAYPGQQPGIAARQVFQPRHFAHAFQTLGGASVSGQQDGGGHAPLDQGPRHAGDCIAQAPGLCQGECFGCHYKNCRRHACCSGKVGGPLKKWARFRKAFLCASGVPKTAG
ncbi:hypothetical protein D3C87_1352100 [compost metagenome]